jgi:ECF sigma factor
MGEDTRKTPVTELLQAWSSGSRAALDELVPLIHDDLRRLVRQRLQSMGPGTTMQATALVNETSYGPKMSNSPACLHPFPGLPPCRFTIGSVLTRLDSFRP